jgi:hypothetical protein
MHLVIDLSSNDIGGDYTSDDPNDENEKQNIQDENMV